MLPDQPLDFQYKPDLDYSALPLPRVTATYEGIEVVIPPPQHDLRPAINTLYDISNTSTTMTLSISDTIVPPPTLSESTPLFPTTILIVSLP